MNRNEALEAYKDFSTQTSANVRTLAFAAIAIVWVFRSGSPDQSLAFPEKLVLAGLFGVGALVSDFFQYLYATVAWGIFHRRKEKEDKPRQEDFKAPVQINWPTNLFFGLKILCILLAYVFLLLHFPELLHSDSQTP